jgi:hypothetical protein
MARRGAAYDPVAQGREALTKPVGASGAMGDGRVRYAR